MSRRTSLETVILGDRGTGVEREREKPNGIVEGIVKSIGPDGMKFTIKTWDNGKHEFGPAPWPKLINTEFQTDSGSPGPVPHTHQATATEQLPVKGDRCLVVFTDGGPWVIGWWPKA